MSGEATMSDGEAGMPTEAEIEIWLCQSYEARDTKHNEQWRMSLIEDLARAVRSLRESLRREREARARIAELERKMGERK